MNLSLSSIERVNILPHSMSTVRGGAGAMTEETSTTRLERELRALKKGAGLTPACLSPQRAPLLRLACRLAPADGPEVARTQVAQLIRTYVADLTELERDAVLAAVGLHPQAQFRFLKERLSWIRQRLQRDSLRTADRFVNRSLERLAHRVDTTPIPAIRPNRYLPAGFYTRSLDATVRLDLPRPEWRERRTVIATASGIDRIPVGATVARVPDPERASINLAVVEGGELQNWTRAEPAYYEGTVGLPRVLDAGQAHDYELRYHPSPPDWIQPHYLLTPHLRCDRLTVRVRFRPDRPPRDVWLLDGVPRGTTDDPPGLYAPVLQPDPDGWVYGLFHDLHPGLSYGIRWQLS
jgi:hypothetical protein